MDSSSEISLWPSLLQSCCKGPAKGLELAQHEGRGRKWGLRDRHSSTPGRTRTGNIRLLLIYQSVPKSLDSPPSNPQMELISGDFTLVIANAVPSLWDNWRNSCRMPRVRLFGVQP